MILLDRITKTYPGDEEPALDNVSLHIEPHEFVFLVGKSGAGKSTLIKMITKEEQPDSGKIIIGGIDLDYVKKRHIPHYRRRLGVVFQDYKLLPMRTVYENVAFALEIAGMSNKEISRTVPKVLDLVGLGDKGHKFPTHLSGGEQQRVSIARSVARQPKILIADEPTGNLDKLTKQEIIELLQRINDFGTTIMVTTHDESIVNNLSKRVITLKDGRIIDDQKQHGIYRLENEPLAESTPHVPIIQRIFMPGTKKVVRSKAVSGEPAVVQKDGHLKDGDSLKIKHETKKRAKTAASATKKTAKGATSADVKGAATKAAVTTSAKSTTTSQKPTKVSTKKYAQDSANQWYTASRPLKAAPKLTDFGPGQTVKLKPAPSMSRIAKQPLSPKPKTKQVI